MLGMKYLRYRRIAFSAVCGLIAVLLIVLWVRSYGRASGAQLNVLGEMRGIKCTTGTLVFFSETLTNQPPPASGVFDVELLDLPGQSFRDFPFGQFAVESNQDFILMNVPICIPVVCATLFGLVPWARRFSLRTLLIAITLIGLLLGLIIATTR
jgi:hypothetical protein